ncbi:hypothetical protein DAI22_09g101901 [Oryza sativa Japonica Group]|nr:hypothetical protein DAI22_09g101901 [Oryza sativa Japonica Group]
MYDDIHSSWIDLLGQQAGAASPPYKNVPGWICSASKKLLLHTQIPGLICSVNKGVVPLPLLADLRCFSALAIFSTTINDASSSNSLYGPCLLLFYLPNIYLTS